MVIIMYSYSTFLWFKVKLFCVLVWRLLAQLGLLMTIFNSPLSILKVFVATHFVNVSSPLLCVCSLMAIASSLVLSHDHL